MARFLVTKRLRALYPIDENGEMVVQKMGQGEVVEVEMRRPRNLRHHRLYWALVSLVWQQLDHAVYPTTEDLHTEIKIATGHYDKRCISIDGKWYTVLTPKSIAFHAMDQEAFSAFYERVCDWMVENILPGVEKLELQREIEEMTGLRTFDGGRNGA